VTQSTVAAALLFVACAVGVSRLQPGLARAAHDVKEQQDIFALPPPAELHVATLGWDAAAVDMLWSQLLVDYGTHWVERREFDDTSRYADAILELEPTYPPLYQYISTMLVYHPLQGTEQDARMARKYLERGTRERPQDGEVWLIYGESIAYVAPTFLHDPAEADAWRKDGATAIGHAVELGANPERALTAAALLNRAGSPEAAIPFLERAYAFTDQPGMEQLHEEIGRRLATLQATRLRSQADATARAVDARWQAELPFLRRGQYVVVGPSIDPARCAGLSASEDPACARRWPSVEP
jgi:hypothetical protein